MILFFPLVIFAAIGLVGEFYGLPLALLSGGALFTGFAGLVAWGIWNSRGPRSPFEDSTHIVLTGVSPKFALACEQLDENEAEQVGDNLGQMFADHARGSEQNDGSADP